MRQALSAIMIAIILPASITISACKTNPKSDLSHDAENPVGSTLPYFWVEQSQDDYLANTLNGFGAGGFRTEDIWDTTNPMVQRLQLWSDRLYALLKDRYPGTLDNVPRPIINVVESDIVNAFAGSAPLCLTNVYVNSSVPAAKPREDCNSLSYMDDETIQVFGSSTIKRKKASFAELSAYVNMHNNSPARCKVQIIRLDSDNFVVRAGAGCEKYGDTGDTNLAIYSMSNNVTIFTALLKGGSEEDALGTLYHELGHYFHAHGLVTRDLNYAFKLGPTNEPGAPLRDPNGDRIIAAFNQTKGIGLRLDEAVREKLYSTNLAIYKKHENQAVHGYLMNLLVNGLSLNKESVCGDANFVSVCKTCTDADAALKAFPTEDYPMGIVGDEDETRTKQYLDFETKAMQCFAGIKMVEKMPLQPAGNLRSLKGFQADVSRSDFLNVSYPGFTYFEGTYKDYVTKLSAAFSENAAFTRIESSYKIYTDEIEELRGLSKARKQSFDTLTSLNQSLKDQGYGYFSIEQEADELGAEWLHLLGFSGSVMGDSSLLMLDSESARANCEAKRTSNWKDAQGQAFIIPWGPIDDPHPEACFRVRDADLEAAAHGYGPIKKSPTVGLTPSWTDLLASIAAPRAPIAVAVPAPVGTEPVGTGPVIVPTPAPTPAPPPFPAPSTAHKTVAHREKRPSTAVCKYKALRVL